MRQNLEKKCDIFWRTHSVVVKRHFKPLLATAGIEKLRPYELRHTMATLGLDAGIHVKVISERLGHATVKQTLQTYSHVLPGAQARAAKVLGDYLHSPGLVEREAANND